VILLGFRAVALLERSDHISDIDPSFSFSLSKIPVIVLAVIVAADLPRPMRV
jgi:hypothetical protein